MFVDCVTPAAKKKNILLLLVSCLILVFCFSPSKPSFVSIQSRNSVSAGRMSLSERVEKHREYMHLVLPYDLGEYNVGMKALINSISMNAKTPEKIFLHFIVEPKHVLLASYFVSELELKLPGAVDFSIWTHWDRYKHLYPTHNRFGNSLNVGRIYLPILFPMVEKIISLDTDQVLNGDVAELWQTDLTKFSFASTQSDRAKRLRYYMNLDNPIVNSSGIDLEEKVFGGGLFAANLTAWRQQKTIDEIHWWCIEHSHRPVMADRTLKKTLLNLVFNKKFVKLPVSWNAGNCMINSTASKQTKILHFAGWDGKPWDLLSNCNDYHRDLWDNYFSWTQYMF